MGVANAGSDGGIGLFGGFAADAEGVAEVPEDAEGGVGDGVEEEFAVGGFDPVIVGSKFHESLAAWGRAKISLSMATPIWASSGLGGVSLAGPPPKTRMFSS